MREVRSPYYPSFYWEKKKRENGRRKRRGGGSKASLRGPRPPFTTNEPAPIENRCAGQRSITDDRVGMRAAFLQTKVTRVPGIIAVCLPLPVLGAGGALARASSSRSGRRHWGIGPMRKPVLHFSRLSALWRQVDVSRTKGSNPVLLDTMQPPAGGPLFTVCGCATRNFLRLHLKKETARLPPYYYV